ncbi:hypothetical protein [Methylocystis sp.]|uniref:hypothetical protein n=1 Tax=Methylocystis sp. TaxID=1911079 RepID=UPI003DA2A6AA
MGQFEVLAFGYKQELLLAGGMAASRRQKRTSPQRRAAKSPCGSCSAAAFCAARDGYLLKDSWKKHFATAPLDSAEEIRIVENAKRAHYLARSGKPFRVNIAKNIGEANAYASG